MKQSNILGLFQQISCLVILFPHIAKTGLLCENLIAAELPTKVHPPCFTLYSHTFLIFVIFHLLMQS